MFPRDTEYFPLAIRLLKKKRTQRNWNYPPQVSFKEKKEAEAQSKPEEGFVSLKEISQGLTTCQNTVQGRLSLDPETVMDQHWAGPQTGWPGPHSCASLCLS